MKFVILGFIIGGITNVLVEMKRNNGLMLPKKLKTKIKLGFIFDFFVGGLSGALFVAFTEPTTVLKTFILAVVGGFGGVGTIERIAQYNGIYKDNKQFEIDNARNQKLDDKEK